MSDGHHVCGHVTRVSGQAFYSFVFNFVRSLSFQGTQNLNSILSWTRLTLITQESTHCLLYYCHPTASFECKLKRLLGRCGGVDSEQIFSNLFGFIVLNPRTHGKYRDLAHVDFEGRKYIYLHIALLFTSTASRPTFLFLLLKLLYCLRVTFKLLPKQLVQNDIEESQIEYRLLALSRL